MKYFALLRHAATLWNAEKKIQGREDLPLSPEGEKQAEDWAGRLKPFSFKRIISSPMKRAHQTSEIIARQNNLDIELVDDLREQDFGDWEGKTIKDLRDQFPGVIETQEKLGWDFCPPNGEPRKQVLDRATRALLRMGEKTEGNQCIVVTHNTVMKCLIYNALGLGFTPENKKELKPYHLHWMELEEVKEGRKAEKVISKMINAMDLEA